MKKWHNIQIEMSRVEVINDDFIADYVQQM